MGSVDLSTMIKLHESTPLPDSPRYRSFTSPFPVLKSSSIRIFFSALLIAVSIFALLTPSDSSQLLITDERQPRIIGGEQLSGKPHSTVLIKLYETSRRYPSRYDISTASGSILTSRYILTAAHTFAYTSYVQNRIVNKVMAKLKVEVNDNGRRNTVQSFNVRLTDLIMNPDYYHSLSYKRKSKLPLSDVAIIRLRRDIKFFPLSNAMPVTLGVGPNVPLCTWYPANKQVQVVGWGRSSLKYDTRRQLKTTNLTTKTTGWCSQKARSQGYPRKTMKLPDMFCASGASTRPKTQLCFGDSGGPLYMNHKGKKVQIGINTWVDATCSNDFNAFGKITYHLPFIQQSISSSPDHRPLLQVVNVVG